jgi:predicted acyl esterase
LLFAYLEELPPQGEAKVLAFGRLAASYRKEAAAPYDTLGLPWHRGNSGDHAPLVGGKPVSLRFALTPTARRIAAGTRLRLVITGADPRQRNLAAVRVHPAPRITLHTGGRTAARIELPLEAIDDKALAAGADTP